MERLISKYQWILGLFNSPFFIVSKSTHFRTKEGVVLCQDLAQNKMRSSAN